MDWTSFDGPAFRAQVLKVGLARRGRVIPLLPVADDRDALPAAKSPNRLEEEALAAVLAALPPGGRPVLLAGRGFARAASFRWLLARPLAFVVRLDQGTCVADAAGRRIKLGTERGERRWLGRVRSTSVARFPLRSAPAPCRRNSEAHGRLADARRPACASTCLVVQLPTAAGDQRYAGPTRRSSLRQVRSPVPVRESRAGRARRAWGGHTV